MLHPGENFNLGNLQRYFSSLELSGPGSYNPATDPAVPSPLPNTSRSVEADFYKTDKVDDDNQSAFTGVTGVTGVTSASKAGGVTQRLKELGVDLEHLRHLRVVSKKADQEAEDAKFEKLSKGIRYCPECGASNKAYMDWCTECGEVLIGVEPTLPYSKKKDDKKKKGSSSKGGSNRDAVKREFGSGDLKIEDVESSRSNTGYFPKDSPESGRGVSLSNSPVRYRGRRSEKEVAEPKDSGRASSGERAVTQSDSEGVDREEDSSAGNEESQSDFFEQISDPVLKEFIISYRNRQISGDVAKKSSPKTNHKSRISSKTEITEKRSSPKVPSVTNGKDKSRYILKKKDENSNQGNSCQEEDSGTDFINTEVKNTESVPQKSVKKKSKKSKKKNKEPPMDVEIFGYEESRISQDSTRGLNLVPMLNLKGSSDESSGEDDDSSSDDSGSEIDDIQDDYVISHDMSNDNLPRFEQSDFSIVEEVSEEDEDEEDEESSSYRPPGQSSSSSQTQVSVSANSMRKVSSNTHNAGTGVARPSKPQSSSGTPAKKSTQSSSSSVRASLDQGSQRSKGTPAGYQRHWARSSVAWSSYNPRELSTRSVSWLTIYGYGPSICYLTQLCAIKPSLKQIFTIFLLTKYHALLL